ncbi:MAG: hypothetical protein L0241_17460 [Planctomycetia bacterium]|nr:hypothetical protein [Planctomycetia bacterium]
MRFLCLTDEEVAGVVIQWDDHAAKSPELVAAALAGGFTEREIRLSPLGSLEADWNLGVGCHFRRGARAVMGTNGTVLLELPE